MIIFMYNLYLFLLIHFINFLNINFMNRKFVFAAVAAMFGSAMLTSCSNDDEVAGGSPVSPQSSAISYNFGFNGKATRGLGLVGADATDAAKIPNMQVWAYYAPDANGTGVTPGAQYIGVSANEGITVTNLGGGSWKEDAQYTAYWPALSATLNFQAIAPASDPSFSVANNVANKLAHMVATVTVPENNSLQKDILMANADKVTEESNSRKVQLNFKHVLSQVRFSVKTASQQVSGEIKDIALCNIKQKGTVGFQGEDAGTNEADWAVVLASAEPDNLTAKTTYSIGMVGDGTFGVAEFTTAKDMTAADGSLLMLPQTTEKWATADGSAVTIAAADAAYNTYIKITCKIKNGNTYLLGGEGEDDFGYVYIPFKAEWEMGKKYIYTINIGTGKGGFDENGNPLIQPISYSVAVADWTNANSEVEL